MTHTTRTMTRTLLQHLRAFLERLDQRLARHEQHKRVRLHGGAGELQAPANQQQAASLSLLDRVAVYVTDRIGTFSFFLIIAGWTLGWLGWNVLAPAQLRFDPFPAFVLWLFISNLMQIHLMPLLMVGQNLQGRHAELRAEADHQRLLTIEAKLDSLVAARSASEMPAASTATLATPRTTRDQRVRKAASNLNG